MDMLWFKARRVISVLLVFAMLASVTPVQAFAVEEPSAETASSDMMPEEEPSVTEETEQTNADSAEEVQNSEEEEAETVPPEADSSVEETPEADTAPVETPQTDSTPAEVPEADSVPVEDPAEEMTQEEPAAEETPAASEPSAEAADPAENEAEPAGDAQADSDAETMEEPTVSQQTLNASADSMNASVTAALPTETKLAVTKMSGDELGDDRMQSLMEAVNSNEIREIEAYDITLTDAQGNAYTLPEGQTATVTLNGISLQVAEGQTLYAVHLKADGSVDMGTINGSTVTFTVDSFSPFVVAAVGSAQPAPAEENAEEQPAEAPEESAESAEAGTYAAVASTYSSKYRNYFVNSTTDSNVEIWYSTDGQNLNKLENGGTISFKRPVWPSKDYEIVAIQFYIVTKQGYDYQFCAFNGTDKVRDGAIPLNDSRNTYLGFAGEEIDFTVANQKAAELGAEYAFHFSGTSLTSGLLGAADSVQRFLVSTDWNQQTVKIIYHRNTSAADKETIELLGTVNQAGTLWKGEMWNGQNGDKILVGWNTQPDGNGEQYALTDWYTPTAEEQDLYAVWDDPTVTVTYNTNGGSWSGPKTDTPDKGEAYTVNSQVPIRNGYQFQGWQINGQGKLYPENGTIPAELMQQDVTLIASWKNMQKYSVAVSLSTVSGTMLKSTTKDDVQWDTLSTYKTMTGYELANTLLGTQFTADSEIASPVWEPTDLSEATHEYTVSLTINDESEDLVKVSYMANGAEGTTPAAVTLVKGDSCTVASAKGLSKTGHVFGGWKYNENTYNVDDANTENNTIANVQEDIVLTAQWTPIQYTVTWMNQDGTQTLGTTPVAYGNKPVYKGAAPTKDSTDGEEFSFAGWSTEKNQTQGKEAENLEVVTGNVTYYAAFSVQTRRYPYTINHIYRDTENNDMTVKQSEDTADYGKNLSDLVGTPQTSVKYGETSYVYSGNNADGKTIGTNSDDNVINLYYDIDALSDLSRDQDQDSTNGDGIADKYQMTVTYKVVNGNWDDDTAADMTEVVTLMEGDAYSENGTASLDQVPEVGSKPNTGMYGDESCWNGGAEPTAATRENNCFVYIYKEKTDVTITFANDSLTYNGNIQTGKDTFTSTLNSALYTVAVERYQAPQGKDVKAGGYQGNAKGATVTITDKATGQNVTYRYNISCVAGTLTIEPKTVTVSLRAENKIYDGTTNPGAYTLLVDGAVNGETVTATAQQVSFDNADAGQRTVTARGLALSSSNYTLNATQATASAVITPKPLDVTVSFQDRVYDKDNTAVQVSGAKIADGQVVAGDTVTVSAAGTGTIAADSVQDNAKVNSEVQPTLSGADADNYTLGNVSYGTVNILGVVTYDTNAGDDDVTWSEPDEIQYHKDAQVLPTENLPTRKGYTCLGWSVDPAAETPDASFAMGDTGLKLYAVWRAQDVAVNVTYHYGTEEPVTTSIDNKKFDETLTVGMGEYDLPLEAKTNYQEAAYTLSSVTVNGDSIFTLSADNYQNPTMDETVKLNELTMQVDVYYVADNGGDGIPDQYQVTVNYAVSNGFWNDNTDTVKSEKVTLLNGDGRWDETGSGVLSAVPEVSEKADAGYTAGSWNAAPETAVIRSGDEGKTFTYTYAVDAGRQYTVTYSAQANGSVTAASEKEQVLSNAGLQGSAATPANGYVFDGWYKGDSKISSETVLSAETVQANLNKTVNEHGMTVYQDTAFTARFTIRTDLGYTVRYLEDGTASVLASEKIVSGQTFGATVTETAPDIAGYTLTSDKNPQTITIGTGDNVITFYYKAVGAETETTPAPTESPAPLVTPTTPAAPTAPTAPTAPAGPTVTAAPEEVTEEPAEEQIQDQETPLAPNAGEEETIGDEETPLAGGSSAWALLNLILTILTALGSVVLVIGYFGKKRSIWHLISLIPGIGAIVAFALTQDMSQKMAFVDRWTLLMVIIAVVQIVIAVLSMKNKPESDEDSENA